MTPELAFALGFGLYPLISKGLDALFREPADHRPERATPDPKVIPLRPRPEFTQTPDIGRGA